MVLNLILVFPFAHAGLALATSLSAYFNAYMLYRGLRKAGAYEHQTGWPRFLLIALLANSALLALILVLMGPAAQWLDWGRRAAGRLDDGAGDRQRGTVCGRAGRRRSAAAAFAWRGILSRRCLRRPGKWLLPGRQVGYNPALCNGR